LNPRKRLIDAQNEDLDPDIRFDLAYGAAHRLALAALRREAIVPRTASLCFRRRRTPSGQTRPIFKLSSRPTTSETSPNIKAAWKSTRSFWQHYYDRRSILRPKSEACAAAQGVMLPLG
jgi:hypothetical protein